MADKYEDLELEGHTVKTFRWHVSEDRHSFALECVTKGNRRMMIEFPSEGLVTLETCVREALDKHPQARGWKSPTAH